MSEAAMEKALPKLPAEITIEILTRVPVKPLLRFRCVSKHFCALIDSPYFVNKHLKHSIANLRFIVSSDTQPHIYSAPFEVNNNIKLAVTRLNLPLKNISNYVLRVLGSCNGLICLTLTTLEQRKLRIVFWNPAVRKHWNLRPLVITPPCKLPAYVTSIMNAYGFGYVSQCNDYRMVCIQQIYECSITSVMVLGTGVDVYSLRSNLWRRIDGFPHGNILLCRRQCPVLVNECLHWPISEPLPSHPYDLVVAFEIGSESFRMVSLPMVKVTGIQMSVQALGGCLCASYQFDNVGFDVWVMKKYGVKESWTKLFTIDHSNVCYVNKFSVWVPIAYSRNGDKVFLFLKHFFNYNGRIISYDLVRRTVEEVDIHGLYNSIMAYSESLVNPNDECLHDGEMQHSQENGRGSSRKRKACSSKSGSIMLETDGQ